MEYKKFIVAEGIMDAKEDLDTNLENIESVREYASNGLNINLSDAEAQLILDICQKMRSRLDSGDIPTTTDWYHDYEFPLKHKEISSVIE